MSALPGHDRITEDEKRAEAATQEHDGPVSVNAPGRDLLAELLESIRRDPRTVAQPTKRDTEAKGPAARPDQG